ncbi:MAG: hypothetical protein AAFY76_20440, partial [Cyanobacteria bacterium J06649_11]
MLDVRKFSFSDRECTRIEDVIRAAYLKVLASPFSDNKLGKQSFNAALKMPYIKQELTAVLQETPICHRIVNTLIQATDNPNVAIDIRNSPFLRDIRADLEMRRIGGALFMTAICKMAEIYLAINYGDNDNKVVTLIKPSHPDQFTHKGQHTLFASHADGSCVEQKNPCDNRVKFFMFGGILGNKSAKTHVADSIALTAHLQKYYPLMYNCLQQPIFEQLPGESFTSIDFVLVSPVLIPTTEDPDNPNFIIRANFAPIGNNNMNKRVRPVAGLDPVTATLAQDSLDMLEALSVDQRF